MAEVPLQRGLAVLAAELEGSDRRLPLCQLPQLLHVLDRVRHRDEPAAGTKHARELREREIEIADVEEHPGRQGDVELTVAERKRARVTDAGVESLGALDLDHPRRLVDPYQLNVKLAKEALRHLAFAAADLEHPPWTRLHNGIVCHVARGRALRRRVNGLPRREVRLRLVLCADERRVVGACQPRATLGSLSSPSAAISSRIFSCDPPDESDSDEYARPDSSASSTSSSSAPAAFASSGIVGERPSCTVSCSTSRESCTFSSCRPRGTRTDQPLSRKCRLISPMMLGVA